MIFNDSFLRKITHLSPSPSKETTVSFLCPNGIVFLETKWSAPHLRFTSTSPALFNISKSVENPFDSKCLITISLNMSADPPALSIDTLSKLLNPVALAAWIKFWVYYWFINFSKSNTRPSFKNVWIVFKLLIEVAKLWIGVEHFSKMNYLMLNWS